MTRSKRWGLLFSGAAAAAALFGGLPAQGREESPIPLFTPVVETSTPLFTLPAPYDPDVIFLDRRWHTRLPPPEPFGWRPPVDWPFWVQETWDDTAEAVSTRLRIGLRLRYTHLLDNSRSLDNSYLGSITKLESQSNFSPLSWLFLDWMFDPVIGLRLGFEQVRAKTVTGNRLVHTDGTLDIFGPGLSLLLRYPNETRFTPVGQIGYVRFFSSFEHDPIWHNGFGGEDRQANYDRWRADGSPAWPNNGYRRTITPEDTNALLIQGALECQVTPRLECHLFAGYMAVGDVKIEYSLSTYERVHYREKASFPMSHASFGGGFIWTF